MPNPTGSTYLTANPSYVWTDGDTYQIPQTDQVEGASTGASFGGQGVDNQPHQILLNKIQYTHANQLVDEANITALLAFLAKFQCSMGPTGWKKTPMQDSTRGAIVVIEQWGVLKPTGGLRDDASWTVTWPIPFPNACEWTSATLSNSSADFLCGRLVMETVSFSKTAGVFFSDYIGNSATNQDENDGFYWRAIGF